MPGAGAQHPKSLNGDMYLVLDDGTNFSILQGLTSQHADFPDAASSSPQQPSSKRCRQQLELPLPETTRRQALLLLHCLYSMARESWLTSLIVPELIELARISHT